jgi:molybdopterin-guanine dinucleotide biosynthesis protein A
VVLAGGRSSRFGSDKLAVPERGVPLLRRAVSALAEVCGDVVVVLSPDGAEPATLGRLPVRFARDEVEGEGPLAGVCAGLELVDTDLALLAAGDMPELAVDVLALLLRTAQERPADGVVLGERGTWRPLPCVVRTARARPAARRLFAGGTRSVRGLLSQLHAMPVDEATWRGLDPAGGTLRDVDRREDLAAD